MALENKLGLLVSAAEIIEYGICCLLALSFPKTVIDFDSDRAEAFDTISGVVVCSMALAVTLYLQTSLYHSQQKKTEEALSEVRRQSQTKDVTGSVHIPTRRPRIKS